MTGLTSWPTGSYDGSRRAQAALKNLTSDLIGRFCTQVQHATHAAHGPAPLRRHHGEVVVPRATRLEISVLKGLAAHYVMRDEQRVALLHRQRELLSELVTALCEAGPEAFAPDFRADLAEATADAARVRVVVDQVASLTDASALSWHRRLTGHG